MTQPIQEPSTDRALQGMAYARDQIFRRPAPVAQLDIPWIVLKDIGTGQTMTTGTNDIIYTEACNDYPEYFDYTEFSAGRPWRVDILVPGLYSFSGNLAFASPPNTQDHWIEVLHIDPSSGPQYVREYYQHQPSIGDTWEGTWRLDEGQSIESQLAWPAVASVDVVDAYFEVRFLGPATMNARDRDSPCGS